MSHESFPSDTTPTPVTPDSTRQEIVELAPANTSEHAPIEPVESGEMRESSVETAPSIDFIAEPGSERLVAYWNQRSAVEQAYEHERAHIAKLEQIRAKLNITTSKDAPQEAALLDQLETAVVEAQANYPGHPTLLLHERLQHPEIRNRFMELKSAARSFLYEDDDAENQFRKHTQFKQHYTNQLDAYDANLERVFTSTDIGEAADFNKQPAHLGRNTGIGMPGTVFTDAAHRDGTPLTSPQKAIIEAHEKGHGMRDFVTTDEYATLISALDQEKMREYRIAGGGRPNSYMQHPEEIVERMSQLKNYFGFRGAEPFTKKHIGYARAHYVTDTGLDNMMSEFFTGITPETEEHFIQVMNTYPI
jgi:hypothetical protein